MNATWNVRDALLLAFEELSSYGVLTVPAATGETAQVRFELARALMAAAPFGLGSYAFWLEADEHLFADGRPPAALHQRAGGRHRARRRPRAPGLRTSTPSKETAR